jgi:hypothetical protein
VLLLEQLVRLLELGVTAQVALRRCTSGLCHLHDLSPALLRFACRCGVTLLALTTVAMHPAWVLCLGHGSLLQELGQTVYIIGATSDVRFNE